MKIPEFSPLEHYRQAAKKGVAAGTILLNGENKFLIVKPNYREGWLLPGGAVEQGESPREGAARETLEEVGLIVDPSQLLAVEYKKYDDGREYAYFVFYGGHLDAATIATIKLQEDEIDDHRFIAFEEAGEFLALDQGRWMHRCPGLIKERKTLYLENGEVID